MTTANGITEPVGSWLSSLIAELLGTNEQEIPFDRPLGELGMDSLTAAQLSADLEERFGALISLERFLGEETLAELVHQLERDAAATSAAQEAGA
ncbi:acyl carrier protein [Streptomyces botrytidirepellens]|uniref:Acyl carrier protein n=1 Tax=Streptomyces botrytidirepellens TaxID=2486417 RepID=A0A3M8SFR1_9ACTN|nr:acyl carrier protein [Streptomyces botrytidirepellens]